MILLTVTVYFCFWNTFKQNFFYIYINLFFIYFSLAVLGLRCCVRASRCGSRASHCGGFSCRGAWALGTWALVVVARGLWSTGSVVVAHGLSCSASTDGW